MRIDRVSKQLLRHESGISVDHRPHAPRPIAGIVVVLGGTVVDEIVFALLQHLEADEAALRLRQVDLHDRPRAIKTQLPHQRSHIERQQIVIPVRPLPRRIRRIPVTQPRQRAAECIHRIPLEEAETFVAERLQVREQALVIRPHDIVDRILPLRQNRLARSVPHDPFRMRQRPFGSRTRSGQRQPDTRPDAQRIHIGRQRPQARGNARRVADPLPESLVPAIVDDEGPYSALVCIADLLAQALFGHDRIPVGRGALHPPGIVIKVRLPRNGILRDLVQQIIRDCGISVPVGRQDAERGPDRLIPPFRRDLLPIQIAAVPDPVAQRQAAVRERSESADEPEIIVRQGGHVALHALTAVISVRRRHKRLPRLGESLVLGRMLVGRDQPVPGRGKEQERPLDFPLPGIQVKQRTVRVEHVMLREGPFPAERADAQFLRPDRSLRHERVSRKYQMTGPVQVRQPMYGLPVALQAKPLPHESILRETLPVPRQMQSLQGPASAEPIGNHGPAVLQDPARLPLIIPYGIRREDHPPVDAEFEKRRLGFRRQHLPRPGIDKNRPGETVPAKTDSGPEIRIPDRQGTGGKRHADAQGSQKKDKESSQIRMNTN